MNDGGPFGKTSADASGMKSLGGWLLLAGFWLWLAVVCTPDWKRGEDYSFGWLVLPLAAYFLWKRLERIRGEGPGRFGERAAAAVLITTAVLACPLELLRQAPVYWRIFSWTIYFVVAAASLSILFILGGGRWLRSSAFPLLFLSTAVPWPTAIEYPLTTSMMHAVVDWAGAILPLVGYPCERQGTVLVLGSFAVGVEEACSGIRSLQLSVMLGLAAGEWAALRAAWRAGVVLFAALAAVASNAVRTMILVAAGLENGEKGVDAIHNTAGNVALVLLVGSVFGFVWLIRKSGLCCPGAAPPASENAVPQTVRYGSGTFQRRLWLFVGSVWVGGLLLANGWYLWNEAGRGPVQAHPVAAVRQGDFVTVRELPENLFRVLSPSMGSLISTVGDDGRTLHGYHLFWDDTKDTNRALFHRPERCMPGGGWVLLPGETTVETVCGDAKIRWRAIPYAREGEKALLLWTAWMDGFPLRAPVISRGSVQGQFLLETIALGRRKFSYEVAAVMVGWEGGDLPLEAARQAAQKMFYLPAEE